MKSIVKGVVFRLCLFDSLFFFFFFLLFSRDVLFRLTRVESWTMVTRLKERERVIINTWKIAVVILETGGDGLLVWRFISIDERAMMCSSTRLRGVQCIIVGTMKGKRCYAVVIFFTAKVKNGGIIPRWKYLSMRRSSWTIWKGFLKRREQVFPNLFRISNFRSPLFKSYFNIRRNDKGENGIAFVNGI